MGSVLLGPALKDGLQFREPQLAESIDSWKGLVESCDDSRETCLTIRDCRMSTLNEQTGSFHAFGTLGIQQMWATKWAL